MKLTIKHIFDTFSVIFFANSKKKLKFKHWALFSVYYDKQYIVDGFWMMGVPLMDHK